VISNEHSNRHSCGMNDTRVASLVQPASPVAITQVARMERMKGTVFNNGNGYEYDEVWPVRIWYLLILYFGLL
jgi:hypothetical protein